MTSTHVAAMRRLSAEQSPLGVAARKILEDLAEKDARIAELEERLREYQARVTLGGPPPKPVTLKRRGLL